MRLNKPMIIRNLGDNENFVLNKYLPAFLLILIILVGFALRLSFFIGSNFPLHDGGFFYVLLKDLVSNKFSLPEYSTYNNANIPFIYPPLGLYITGIIEFITGADSLQIFRYIPLILSTLCILTAYLLSSQITKNKWAAIASTTVYSLLPMGYGWLILGGGITRSFGAIFAILALYFVLQYFDSGARVDAIISSVCCGLTVLSHAEWAWFLFYSLGLLVIYKISTKTKQIFARAIILFFGTSLVILPWLLSIIFHHGISIIQPFLDNGFSKWIDITKFILLMWSNETLFPIITLLAIIGIFYLLKKRGWFVPIWLLIVFFLQGRAAEQKAVIPLAILAGAGGKYAFDYIETHYPRRINIRYVSLFVLGIYLYIIISSMLMTSSFIKPLSTQFITGVEWMKRETPSDATFMVITGEDWTLDKYSEWIVALTGRESVSVVQGYEWLPGFSNRINRYNQMQYAYLDGMNTFINWIEQNNVNIDFLIFPKINQTDINDPYNQPVLHMNDALGYPGAKIAFENSGVLILDLRDIGNR
jgi:hypothetical protein